MHSITAIIPTFNRAHTIERAIDSVLSQTIPCTEIIVIDDGSTDETSAILEKYKLKNQIIVIKTENHGVSAARNQALKIAKGNWISFLDSDDEWLPEKNKLQIACQLETNCSLIHGEEIWIRNGKKVNPKFKHQKFGGMIFEKCIPLCLISPSATMIDKNVLQELGGFDEEFVVCEDYDLWLKFTLDYPVGFVVIPIINKYGGHEDQLSMKYKAMDYYRIKSMMRILKEKIVSREQKLLIQKEIKTKGTILLNGYIKHQNMLHYEEVKNWLHKIE
jgi:glycosyltransferase involved in cell wall biosynthesis